MGVYGGTLRLRVFLKNLRVFIKYMYFMCCMALKIIRILTYIHCIQIHAFALAKLSLLSCLCKKGSISMSHIVSHIVTH